MSGSLLLSILFIFTTSDIYIPHFQNGGTWENGFLLNFTLTLKQSFAIKPSEYDLKQIDEISSEYHTDLSVNKDYPNIIVLMNESFADFCVLDDTFCTKHKILPFYHSLTENTVKGYALTSIYGGKTPNAEFEFLTGNTMAFLPEGSIPYQQFVHDNQYSMVSILNSLGYTCMATHPYRASGWNRPNVYERFGFSETTFLEDYPQDELLRNFVSDKVMYEYVISQYENREPDKPWFLFGVTMQNHGSYTYPNFNDTVTLDEYSEYYPDAEQYLSVVKYSDQALEYLIDYFSHVSEKVLIVMFGDHFPGLDDNFYKSVYGNDFSSLNSEMNLYKVPFLLWANYDIEEKVIPCTSLNYLSNYVYEAADIPLPAFNSFLSDVEEVIPAINALGFYSLDKGGFITFSEASMQEQKILNIYENIQYNGLFDRSNRNIRFYPNHNNKSEK